MVLNIKKIVGSVGLVAAAIIITFEIMVGKIGMDSDDVNMAIGNGLLIAWCILLLTNSLGWIFNQNMLLGEIALIATCAIFYINPSLQAPSLTGVSGPIDRISVALIHNYLVVFTAAQVIDVFFGNLKNTERVINENQENTKE